MYPAFPALDLEEILKILKTAMLNFRNEQMNKVKSNCFQIFEELIKKKKKGKQAVFLWLLHGAKLGGRFWPSTWHAWECVP